MTPRPRRPRRPRLPVVRLVAALAGLAAALTASGCSGTGASDVPSLGPGSTSATATAADPTPQTGPVTLSLSAYSAPKAGWEASTAAFAATPQGAGTTVQASYGASGDQSRKVAAGAPADLVSFSLAPDVTRLVKAGLVDTSWDADAHHGIAFGSVVTFVVRKGNPKHLTTWADLLRPGVVVVTPNPLSSGSAKWNLLAPYAVHSRGGADPAAGLAYVKALLTHVTVQPKSAREASETFLQGTGDVLLSYENEALFLERAGDPVEHVVPAETLRIDNPVAVVATSPNRARAEALLDFVRSPAGQELWARAGFRPVDATVAARHTTDFPTPKRLWTVDDLGGWAKVDPALFDKEAGQITLLYAAAAR